MQTPSTAPTTGRDDTPAAPLGGSSGRPVRRRPCVVVAAAALVALAAAGACGTDGASQPVAACGSPGVTSDAVKIGVLYPDTGPFATTFLGFRGGLQARFSLENSRGGVHGREVAYAWADDRANAKANLLEATRLVEQEQVFAVVEGSVAEAGSAQYLDKQGVPVTGVGPSAVWSGHRNMLTWSSLLSQTAVSSAWGQVARSQGGTRAAVLADVDVPSSQELAAALSASMRSAGIQTVYTNFQVHSMSHIATLARAITNADADVVTGVVTPELAV